MGNSNQTNEQIERKGTNPEPAPRKVIPEPKKVPIGNSPKVKQGQQQLNG
jgi:hypothetical protein